LDNIVNQYIFDITTRLHSIQVLFFIISSIKKFQSMYIILFIVYQKKRRKEKMFFTY